MTSPTSSTPRVMPSAARFATAVSDGQKSRRERRSQTTRLTSSGMRMSNERRPASTCASGSLQLGRDERAGERRVRVAVDEHGVGPRLERRALDADEHRGRLLGVRARADAEPDVGLAQAELLVEDARELVVVVLARVGDDEIDVPARARRAAAPP